MKIFSNKVEIMRLYSLLVLLLFLAGCATETGYVVYRPKNNTGTGWSIYARADEAVFQDTIHITFDDTEVITGTLSDAKPKDSFTGSYEGYKILANCAFKEDKAVPDRHECSLFVEGERAIYLSF